MGPLTPVCEQVPVQPFQLLCDFMYWLNVGGGRKLSISLTVLQSQMFGNLEKNEFSQMVVLTVSH